MKIYYHKNCHDGFACVLLCQKVFPAATYAPYGYQDTLPEIDTSGVIWFVDVALSQVQLDMLLSLESVKKIVVIDHHPSTSKLASNDPRVTIYYHSEKSGARLVWEYLNHNYGLTSQFCSLAKPPDFVTYTEDHDLYKFVLPMSREVKYALQSLDYAKWLNFSTKEWMGMGIPIKRLVDKQIASICEQASRITFEGYSVPIVNSSLHHSDVGNILSEGEPFAIVWVHSEGKYKYSLRSHDFDVSVLCQKYGGGGHRLAAGFNTDKYLI